MVTRCNTVLQSYLMINNTKLENFPAWVNSQLLGHSI